MVFINKSKFRNNYFIIDVDLNVPILKYYFDYPDLLFLLYVEKRISFNTLSDIDFFTLKNFASENSDSCGNLLAPKFLMRDFLNENPKCFLFPDSEIFFLLKEKIQSLDIEIKNYSQELEYDYMDEKIKKLIKKRCARFIEMVIMGERYDITSKSIPFKSFFIMFNFLGRRINEIIG